MPPSNSSTGDTISEPTITDQRAQRPTTTAGTTTEQTYDDDGALLARLESVLESALAITDASSFAGPHHRRPRPPRSLENPPGRGGGSAAERREGGDTPSPSATTDLRETPRDAQDETTEHRAGDGSDEKMQTKTTDDDHADDDDGDGNSCDDSDLVAILEHASSLVVADTGSSIAPTRATLPKTKAKTKETRDVVRLNIAIKGLQKGNLEREAELGRAHRIARSRDASDGGGVRFDLDRSKVHAVPTMTEQETRDAWTTDEDVQRILGDVVSTVKGMRTNQDDGVNVEEAEDHRSALCVAGLEHMSSFEETERRRIDTERVVDAVLDEQDRQRRAREEYGANKIAEAAARSSSIRGSSEPAKAGGGVRFDPDRTETRVVPSLTEEEIGAAWTTGEDVRRSYRDAAATVKGMRTPRLNSEDRQDDGEHSTICTAGLECLSSFEETERRMRDAERVVGAVLDEQDRQYEADEDYDDEKIAQAARAATANPRESTTNCDTAVLLAECADEGIPTEQALEANTHFEKLEEYWWNNGHEREAEAAAAASAEKKGNPNDRGGSRGGGNGNGGGGPPRSSSSSDEGPTKITLPPSMADQARALQTRLKADVAKLLQNAGGDATNPRFLSAVRVLSSIYKGQGYDARSTSSTTTSSAGASEGSTNDDGGPVLEGSWTLLTKPLYPDCLGRNDDGDFMYTLARMSFGMFSPGGVRCSIQSIEHRIVEATANNNGAAGRKEDMPEAVPRKLREIVKESSTCPVLRKYDITVNLTIEPREEEGGEIPGTLLPASRINATMTTDAYLLPDAKVENRLLVWFTGGSLRPAVDVGDGDGAPSFSSPASPEWQAIFGRQSTFGRRTLRERANVIAAKLVLGAELPDRMEEDGSMRYKFHRPPCGHLDVLYHDGDFRIFKGNRGTIMVQRRSGTGKESGKDNTSTEKRQERNQSSKQGGARMA